jgi:hypothetical protein
MSEFIGKIIARVLGIFGKAQTTCSVPNTESEARTALTKAGYAADYVDVVLRFTPWNYAFAVAMYADLAMKNGISRFDIGDVVDIKMHAENSEAALLQTKIENIQALGISPTGIAVRSLYDHDIVFTKVTQVMTYCERWRAAA